MINGLQTSALAAFGQTTKLGIVSNNLANINTPGFRKESLTFGERLVEALEAPEDFEHYNNYVDVYGGAPFIDSMHFDRNAGPLQETGRQLDVAIERPEGYFGVIDPGTGQRLFTRAGNFTINEGGQLVTADGKYRVVGESGEPITMDLAETSEIRIDRNGVIALISPAGEDEVGRIGVFDVAAEQLTKHGDTMLRLLGGQAEPAQGATVRQGYLEGSSVDPVETMVDLIQTTRFVETNLQMIRFQDATLERAINQLGRI